MRQRPPRRMAFQSPRKSSRIASLHTPNDVADDKDARDDKDVPKDKDVPDDKDVAHDADTADDKDAGDDATIIPCDENVNELPDDSQKEKTHASKLLEKDGKIRKNLTLHKEFNSKIRGVKYNDSWTYDFQFNRKLIQENDFNEINRLWNLVYLEV